MDNLKWGSTGYMLAQNECTAKYKKMFQEVISRKLGYSCFDIYNDAGPDIEPQLKGPQI